VYMHEVSGTASLLGATADREALGVFAFIAAPIIVDLAGNKLGPQVAQSRR